ncbi:hypothetical protein JVU11DRAFT_3192 [Chiua virens]|nr:hypothetical protein JVU11DRAFT_3192 [Chiua virens]
MITSATLTKDSLSNAHRLLHMHSDEMVTICRSSDHPNIKIGIKKIKYALNSYADLAFLIPTGWKTGDLLPPKFLIFFDNIQDVINAAWYLHSRLPVEKRDLVKWFNADMSPGYKEADLGYLISGEQCGFATTESFGMGMDVPNIQLVLQWQATCKLAMLWQHFGHAARDKQLMGTAILFAEKDYFDDECVAKAVRKEKQESTQKCKVNSRAA